MVVPVAKWSIQNVPFVTMSAHGFTALISIIESFLSDFYLKYWHIFLIGIFCPAYLLFVIGIRESGIISRFPYGPLLDYYSGNIAILFHFIFCIAYYVVFSVCWLVYTVFKKQLIVKICSKYVQSLKTSNGIVSERVNSNGIIIPKQEQVKLSIP